MLDQTLALICARLSKEIYAEFPSIKFSHFPDIEATLLESINPEESDTQAAMICEPDTGRIYVVFRGTDKGIDWITNLRFRQKVYPYGDTSDTGVRFHRGFMAAYFAVRDALLAKAKAYPEASLIVTGHSLGGAIATIAALDLQYNLVQHTNQPIQLYTFGAPRVGNSALVESFRRRVPQSYRFVNGWDLITRVPRFWQGYAHVPEEQFLGSRWTWRMISRRIKDHYMDSYLKALAQKF